jgi:hypothetical protein
VEGDLSVNSGIAPPTSIDVEYIFELSPGSEVNRSEKNQKQRPLLLMEKEEKNKCVRLGTQAAQAAKRSPFPMANLKDKQHNQQSTNGHTDLPMFGKGIT